MRVGDEAIIGDGRVTEHQLYDHTEVQGYRPFELPPNMPMMNPFQWELMGDWEEGWHIFGNTNPFGGAKVDEYGNIQKATKMIKIENNQVVEAYKLVKLDKDNGDALI